MNDERTPSEQLRAAFIHISGQGEAIHKIADAIETLSNGIHADIFGGKDGVKTGDINSEQVIFYHGGYYVLNQHLFHVAKDIDYTLEKIRNIMD